MNIFLSARRTRSHLPFIARCHAKRPGGQGKQNPYWLSYPLYLLNITALLWYPRTLSYPKGWSNAQQSLIAARFSSITHTNARAVNLNSGQCWGTERRLLVEDVRQPHKMKSTVISKYGLSWSCVRRFRLNSVGGRRTYTQHCFHTRVLRRDLVRRLVPYPPPPGGNQSKARLRARLLKTV